MRTDVKLGVAFSMAVVLIAGAYYFYRDAESKPISLSDQTLADSKKAEAGKGQNANEPSTTPRNRSRTTMPPRIVRPGNAADPSKRPEVVRRDTPQTNDRSNASKPAITRAAPERDEQPDASSGMKPPVAAATDPGRRADAQTKQPVESVTRDKLTEADRMTGPTPIVPKRSPASAASPAVADRTAANRRPVPVSPLTASTEGSPKDIAVDVHHVQPGDSFASLARTYYGSERFTQFLIDNNKQITDPSRLRVGVNVNIPPAPADGNIVLAARSVRSQPKAASDTGDEAGRTYTVKPGDSFYVIARDVLGDASRWKELLALNTDLVNGDPTKLQPDQIVQLPKE